MNCEAQSPHDDPEINKRAEADAPMVLTAYYHEMHSARGRLSIYLMDRMPERSHAFATSFKTASRNAFFDLDELRELLKSPGKVTFIDRSCDKSSDSVGISKQEAIEALKRLTPGEFVPRTDTDSDTADLYYTYCKRKTGGRIRMYVKFWIEDDDSIVVMSFHKK